MTNEDKIFSQDSPQQASALLDALHKAIEIFASYDQGRSTLNDILSDGIWLVAQSAGIDLVSVFRVYEENPRLMSGESEESPRLMSGKGEKSPRPTTEKSVCEMPLSLKQLYRWTKTGGGTVSVDERLRIVPDNPVTKQWAATLMQNQCIHLTYSRMDETAARFAAQFGVKTKLLVPIFSDGEFWGAINFDDLMNERTFDEETISFLQSAARLLSNIIIRAEKTQFAEEAFAAHKNESLKSLANLKVILNSMDALIIENVRQQETLEKILDTLDSCILVTDLETDEILYINQKMKLDFLIEHGLRGDKCWKRIHTGQNGRCQFCPKPRLLQKPDQPIYWEYTNQVTGKVQLNIDRIITWLGGLHVHMQQSFDITKEKISLKALEQQTGLLEAVNEISAKMLRSDTESFDEDLLCSMGVMAAAVDADRVYLWKNHLRDGVLYCTQIYEWSEGVPPQQGKEFTLETAYHEIMPEWEEILSHGRCINNYAASLPEVERKILTEQGVLSVLIVPIFLKERFWGFLGFDDCRRERVFSESEERILRSASELIAAALIRNHMEDYLRLAADQLQEALTQAQSASRAKGDFLSRMSHEMRTPMNAIVGMTNIARGTQDTEKKDACLDKIDGASKHLLGVINDVLDLSKIEANKLELAPYRFQFEKMFTNVANVLNFRIEEKKQHFIVSIDDKIPETVIGDELRITQIVTNLLTNAVKFTPEGGSVTLTAKCLEEDESSSRILIEISDTGIGISEEQQSRLFTAFEQAESGTARKYGGTGLGLAISKHIVEMMGGRIWVESVLGQGTRFSFTVTLKKSDEQLPLPYIDRDSVEVLAVDDSPEIREYFKTVMARFGFRCDTAANGRQALEMISQKQGQPYNIFFVDWLMPEMNGIDFVRNIKKPEPAKSVIIMISGAEWSQVAEEGKKAGIDRFITKPLFPNTLLQMIEDCIDEAPMPVQTSAETTATQEQPNHQYENHSILIAEDVEINREIMAAILEDTKINIDFAENGIEAVKKFEDAPDKYSLILMDIQMPELDGYDATKRIRSLPFQEATTIPILAMTANVFREDVEACLAAGMDDHLGKPIDMDILFEKLQMYL